MDGLDVGTWRLERFEKNAHLYMTDVKYTALRSPIAVFWINP